MKTSAVAITVFNAVLLAVLGVLFSLADAFASFTGPKDDIGMLALLVPFIAWHAVVIGRHGLRVYRNSSLILLGVLGALLLCRYFDALANESRWHANRSFHIFAWTSLWFWCAGFWVRWRCRRHEAREQRRRDSDRTSAKYDY